MGRDFNETDHYHVHMTLMSDDIKKLNDSKVEVSQQLI